MHDDDHHHHHLPTSHRRSCYLVPAHGLRLLHSNTPFLLALAAGVGGDGDGVRRGVDAAAGSVDVHLRSTGEHLVQRQSGREDLSP